jgi:hypothetical protein
MSDQSSTHPRCAHRHADGEHCGRWPSPGSRFCYLHRAANGAASQPGQALARLATPADLFDVIRETLHAVRFGRIQPGQAYAVGYLAHLWLGVYRQLACDDREAALQGGLLDDLVAHDADSLAAAAATPVDPIPPLPDSPVAEAMEAGTNGQPLPYPLSLVPPDPRLNHKGVKRRILAKLLNELAQPSPANGETK